MINLPKEETEPKGEATLSGWGALEKVPGGDNIYPTILQTMTVPILDRKECNSLLKKLYSSYSDNIVPHENICTGPVAGGISACTVSTNWS